MLLYVDDMLFVGSSKDELVHIKDLLSKEFDMKDLEESRKILGIDITRDRDQSTLSISQSTLQMLDQQLSLLHNTLNYQLQILLVILTLNTNNKWKMCPIAKLWEV